MNRLGYRHDDEQKTGAILTIWKHRGHAVQPFSGGLLGRKVYSICVHRRCCCDLLHRAPPTPSATCLAISIPDSWGYFGPAIYWLVDHKVQHISARSVIPYPLILTGILGIFGDFRAIPMFQHCVAIASALLIGIGFFRLAGIIRSSVVRGLVLVVAIPVLVLFLFADESIVYEHSINPEGFVQIFLALNIVLLVECLRAGLIEGDADAGARGDALSGGNVNRFRRMATLLVLNSILIYFTRPQWGVSLFVPPAAVLVLSLPRLSEISIGRLLRWLRPVIQGGVLGLVFIAIPEEIAFNKTDYNSLIERPGTMFAFHADVSMLQVGDERDGRYSTKYTKQELDTAYAAWVEGFTSQ